MNKQFTEEQIEAYATHFRPGDAIWADGKWHEVVENEKYGDNRITSYVPANTMVINNGESGSNRYAGSVDGFKVHASVENPYRVTTLDDYELQGGEKIVWLGENHGFKTHGKAYITTTSTIFKENDVVYIDDDGCEVKPGFDEWAVIPSYKMHIQVKNNPKRNVSDEEFDNFLNDFDKTLAPVKKG